MENSWSIRIIEFLESAERTLQTALCCVERIEDSQMAKQRKTGKKAGTAASKVLQSKRTGKDSKIAAGSALSQRAPKGKGKKKK